MSSSGVIPVGAVASVEGEIGVVELLNTPAGLNGKVVKWNNATKQFDDATAQLNAAYVAQNGAASWRYLAPAPSGGDDTAAIAAAHTAAKALGLALQLRSGVYLVTALTFDGSIPVYGVRGFILRNNIGAFGSGGNATLTNYGGTVVKCTAASGTAVTFAPAAGNPWQTVLYDVVILGPGSGTATGLALANGGSGSVIEPDVHGVYVINFATGVVTTSVEDGDLDLKIWGCTTPAQFTASTNNNRIKLDLQHNSAPGSLDSTCVGNTFDTPIFQSNTDKSFIDNGKANVINNPWCENPAGAAPAIEYGATANGCVLIAGTYSDPTNDRVSIDSGAVNIMLVNVPATVADNGTNTTQLPSGPVPLDTQQTILCVGNPINFSGGWTPQYNSLWGDVNTNVGPALNDFADWAVNMPPGTYRVDFFGGANADAGQVQLSVDGTNYGSVLELYSASVGVASQSVTGIAVTAAGALAGTAGPYMRRLRLKVTGKNASSSNYYARLKFAVITRTA